MAFEKTLFSDPVNLNRFVYELINDIKALEEMLEKDLIESGIQRIGAEQELCLLDAQWRPAPIIMKVLERLKNENFTTEHSQYNLEFNLPPIRFEGSCLSQLAIDLNTHLDELSEVLGSLDSRYILTGILPTVRRSDLDLSNLTPLPRYHLLNDVLNKLRGGPYEFRIEGKDELITSHNSIMFEGCNTSFQIHLQVDPQKMVEAYNWAQAITAPVLAAATNSPLLLGKRLWQETRIALFQLSVDTRKFTKDLRERLPRVGFGTKWLENSISELFQNDLARYRAIVGMDTGRNSLEVLRDGQIPKLKALSLYNGTIYRWNRPCYGITEGKPHLRIENRILPAGPTVEDEVANAAFWFGLMNNQPDEYKDIAQRMRFDDAKLNFLKAAQNGLENQFVWMDKKSVPANELIEKELLPLAKEGLSKANVDSKDIDHYLGIIQERVQTRRTGAHWIMESFEQLSHQKAPYEVVVAVTAGIVRRQQDGQPVHKWEPAGLYEAGNWMNRYWKVGQIMGTDFSTVREDDLVYFVANLMKWKHARYLPVEDEHGKLVGLVSSRRLIDYFADPEREDVQKAVIKTIMIKDPITIDPEALSLDALKLMQKSRVGCLPVVYEEELVGLLTEVSFIDLSQEAIQRLITS